MGFAQIGIRAAIIGSPDILRIVRGRKNNNRKLPQPGLAPHEIEHVEPAEAGHFQVQEQQLRKRVGLPVGKMRSSKKIIDRFATIPDGGQTQAERGSFHRHLNQHRILGIVICD